MLQRVKTAINNMPHGGMGLHGTSFRKAKLIAEQGLTGSGYHTLIPNPKVCNYNLTPTEFYLKTVGSIIFSANYSLSDKHKEAETKPLPAIVIFADYTKNNALFNVVSSDTEVEQYRYSQSFNHKIYLSFGKQVFNIKVDNAVAIVYLSQDELNQISIPIKENIDMLGESFYYAKHTRDKLIIKTLQAIEKICNLGKKPDEIMII